jgi:hypothetical protein
MRESSMGGKPASVGQLQANAERGLTLIEFHQLAEVPAATESWQDRQTKRSGQWA